MVTSAHMSHHSPEKAYRSVQQFLHAGTPQQTLPMILNRGRQPLQLPLSLEGSGLSSGPHVIHGSLDPPESAPKWHLDRFSRFCRAHERDQQQTHRQTHK